MSASPAFPLLPWKALKRIGYSLVLVFIINCIPARLHSQQLITRKFVEPVSRAVVNFKKLSDMEALLPKPTINRPGFIPNEEIEFEEPYSPVVPTVEPPLNANRITVVSPSPVQTYEGAPDGAQTGSGSWTIPPDTYGAVGLDKVFTQLNNNFRILNKSTGAQLSIVSIETFWSALGTDGTSVFDPRVVYDPYNNRWIVAAVSHGGAATSRVLLGISQTHDPQGNYNLYSFDPDPTSSFWADYPMLGFNKNWIAIGINMFPVTTGSTPNLFYVIDYPALRNGTVTSTVFSGTQFCTHPAETYSSIENTLYAPNNFSSAGGTYQLNSITGTSSSPVFNVGSILTRTGGGWSIVGAANAGPQDCVTPPCGSVVKLELPDAQIRNNVVFRNNAIWYTQTVGLPAGGYTRSAAQWTKLNTDGTFNDGGRIDDATATATNGGRWYAYPSVAVNSSNDAIVGFSKLESDGFAGAAYAFRLSADVAGTMQDPVVYQDGLDYYTKDFSSGRNRWGDYSHTMVDPMDDASFWTIQEYAKLRAAPTVGGSNSKWGTWWAKVAPNACLSNIASGNWNNTGTWGCGSVPNATNHVTIVSGHNVTLDVDPLAASITINEGGTLTVSSARTLTCKLIVYGTLNITGGKLTLGNNDVFLSSGSTLTGASSSSYFITNSTGKLSKVIAGGSSFEFPVSPNSTSYNSLNIALNAGDPDEVFSVSVESGVNPSTGSTANNNKCVQRTWKITEMTTGNNNVTLTFKWAVGDQGSTFNNTVPAFAFRHNGSTYLLANTMTTPVLASGFYTVSTTSTVNSFSPWIVSSASTLPVVLDYFTGIKTSNNQHLLSWKATCSGAKASFEIQRSNNAINFNQLTRIDADYARCLQPFSYTDASPLTGKNFYRIKITDENGKVSFSNTILLLNASSGFEIVNLQPNPVNASAFLNISVANHQALTIVVTDNKGSLVLQKEVRVNTGMNQVEINFNTLQSGSYLLTIYSGQGERRTLQFVKQ